MIKLFFGIKKRQTCYKAIIYRMLRAINNTKIKDKISTKSLLEKYPLLSVNQLAANIKLTEAWKSLNQEGYPIKLEPYNSNLLMQKIHLRQQPNRIFKDDCRLKKFESSFCIDAARLWNGAPREVTSAISLKTAKTAIRKYCRLLPVWESY